MIARIGVMRAMNRGQVREFTDAKGHHWGRRKLKKINDRCQRILATHQFVKICFEERQWLKSRISLHLLSVDEELLRAPS